VLLPLSENGKAVTPFFGELGLTAQSDHPTTEEAAGRLPHGHRGGDQR
jgi:hypothetical protein